MAFTRTQTLLLSVSQAKEGLWEKAGGATGDQCLASFFTSSGCTFVRQYNVFQKKGVADTALVEAFKYSFILIEMF